MPSHSRIKQLLVASLALVTMLVSGNVLPSYAADATLVTDPNNPRFTAPTGPVWLGSDPWVGDHFLGFCKLIPSAAVPGTFEPDQASCVAAPNGPISSGHAAAPSGGGVVYIPDNAAVAPDASGVWRLSYAGGAITQRVMIASVAVLGSDKPSTVALGPDGKLYVGFIRSGAIVRIANPGAAGGAVAPIIEPVGTTSDGGEALALAFAGADLYIAQAAAVTKIAEVAACSACSAAATGATASTPTALAYDGGSYLYIGDVGMIERLDVTANSAVLFSTGGTVNGTPTAFRVISGLGLHPTTGDLYVGDDTSGVANVFASRIWRIAAGQAPGGTVASGLRTAVLIASGVSASLTSAGGFVTIGSDVWVTDHAMGFCRLKAGTAPGTVVIDVPTCTTQTHPTSGPTAAGQPTFDPATNFVYLPDGARGSQQVWRYTYNPATRSFGNPVAVTLPSADPDLRPIGSALGPDGNVYASALKSGAIYRITTPNGPAVQIAAASDNLLANGLAFYGSDLYLAEAAAVTKIVSATNPACTPTTCPAQPTGSTAIFPAAITSDGNGYLYIGDGNLVERFEPATGQSVTFASRGLINGAPAPFRFITGLGFGGGEGIFARLYIGDDPSAGGTTLQGRAWLVGPLSSSSMQVQKDVQGISTRYVITNTGPWPANTVHRFDSPTGTVITYTESLTIAVGAARVYDLAALDAVPSGFSGSLVVFSDQPLEVGIAPPVAGFDAAPRSGPRPLEVAFTNQSIGSFSQSAWDFGDGATSTLLNPSHVYSATGPYTVTLTVAGPGGSNTLIRPSLVQVADYVPVDLTLAPYTGTFGLGEIVAVSIQIQAGVQPVDAAAIFLDFDPLALQVVDAAGQPGTTIESTGPLTQVVINAVDNVNGRIGFSAASAGGPPPTGTFTAAIARFRPLTVTVGTSVAFAFDVANNRQTNVGSRGLPVIGQATGGQYTVVSETISGTVSLQAREVASGEPWRVLLKVQMFSPGETAPVYSHTVQADDFGRFAIGGLNAGTYTVTVKQAHTLANVKAGLVVAGGATNVNFCTLLEGDAADNNNINISDFSILAATYGKTAGQTGFDPRADFNNSNQVNIRDFSLLAANYGKFGNQACP